MNRLSTKATTGFFSRAANCRSKLSRAAGEKNDDLLEKLIGRGLRRFDKQGENFYDQISALHKSVRGSDPDGALYWFARMLDGGVDPVYVARRLLRMSIEDIGLADPRAQRLCLDAARALADVD